MHPCPIPTPTGGGCFGLPPCGSRPDGAPRRHCRPASRDRPGSREGLGGIGGVGGAPGFGGRFRQVQIYVHPRTLETLNMSPVDVARIVNRQSTVIPTGEVRIDRQNYYVRSNAMMKDPKE